MTTVSKLSYFIILSMTKPSLERVTITIPAPVLAAADALAARLDRSRSWVLVEAVRRLVASEPLPDPASTSPAAPDPTPTQLAAEEALRARLARSTALSMVGRVQAAEEGARVARGAVPARPSQRIRGFPTQQAYEQWRTGARGEG